MNFIISIVFGIGLGFLMGKTIHFKSRRSALILAVLLPILLWLIIAVIWTGIEVSNGSMHSGDYFQLRYSDYFGLILGRSLGSFFLGYVAMGFVFYRQHEKERLTRPPLGHDIIEPCPQNLLDKGDIVHTISNLNSNPLSTKNLISAGQYLMTIEYVEHISDRESAKGEPVEPRINRPERFFDKEKGKWCWSEKASMPDWNDDYKDIYVRFKCNDSMFHYRFSDYGYLSWEDCTTGPNAKRISRKYNYFPSRYSYYALRNGNEFGTYRIIDDKKSVEVNKLRDRLFSFASGVKNYNNIVGKNVWLQIEETVDFEGKRINKIVRVGPELPGGKNPFNINLTLFEIWEDTTKKIKAILFYVFIGILTLMGILAFFFMSIVILSFFFHSIWWHIIEMLGGGG